LFKPKKLNIGSGRRAWIGWSLLDEISDLNIINTKFSENTKLNFQSDSQLIVYSSHFFEHIDTLTTNNLLCEIKRVLKHDGYLVIKIPNYDAVLESYFNGNYELISKFSFAGLPEGWHRHGVDNSIENKLSMIFAGYFTRGYGDHFLNRGELDKTNGYHGPAKIQKETLMQILESKNPALISENLVSLIKKDASFHRFNHQQAWSNYQFEKYVTDFGFKLLKLTPGIESYLLRNIRDFKLMSDISSYFIFQK
jgi:SAM-dependent methyltransferase